MCFILSNVKAEQGQKTDYYREGVSSEFLIIHSWKKMVVFFINSFNKHLLNGKYRIYCQGVQIVYCWRQVHIGTKQSNNQRVVSQGDVGAQRRERWGGAGSKEGAAKQNLESSYPLLSIPYASWKGKPHHLSSYSTWQPESRRDLTLSLALTPASS